MHVVKDSDRAKDLTLGGVIFPSKATEAAIRANGHVDGAQGVDKEDGWKSLCEDMGWDRYGQRLLKSSYEDGWYAGAIAKT